MEDDTQITVPKRGRPPKAVTVSEAPEAPAVEEAPLVAEEVPADEYKSTPEPEIEYPISEQTQREMEAGRRALKGLR